MGDHDVKNVVDEAVAATLQRLGIDSENVLEAQKLNAQLRDMVAEYHHPESERDRQYARDLRASSENIKGMAAKAVVGVFCSGVLGALWLGIKTYLGK